MDTSTLIGEIVIEPHFQVQLYQPLPHRLAFHYAPPCVLLQKGHGPVLAVLAVALEHHDVGVVAGLVVDEHQQGDADDRALSHGSPVNFSGLMFQPISYTVDANTGRVNYEEMEEKARAERPKLIIAGASAYSREWDYARIRKLADEIGAIFMVDMAHPAGLIAAGLLENPLKHAHIVTTTTHKTLRGPRGGMILMGKDFDNPWGKKTPKGEIKKMSALLDSAVFPGVQGGPLEHVIAAKAVAFGECLQPEWKEYAIQVKKNAQALADALIARGYKIISDGTDNHSMLVDLRPKFPEMSGKKAERVLVEADITANKNMVPYDTRSPFLTSGLRFGTAAITTRGAKEDLMEKIADLIDKVLCNADNEEVIKEVRREVNDTMNGYPMFAW